MYKFKNFEVNVDPPVDHYFTKHEDPPSFRIKALMKRRLKREDHSKTISMQPNAAKRINKEWNILRTSLPDSIFVRAYETRIDLMRAVIVGSKDTPYDNGLFFFDIKFPNNYPNDPLAVVLNPRDPGRLHIHPNFHSDGSLCLSLLNTWIGYDEERWDPQRSTVLQVLVTIQGLVLNGNPYLNHPAVDDYFIFLGNRRYNKKVFMNTNQAMLYMLKNPPKGFEDFVAEHFRLQGHDILSNYKARMNVNSMKELFLDLAMAFEENGLDCKQDIDLVKMADLGRGSLFLNIWETLICLLCCGCVLDNSENLIMY